MGVTIESMAHYDAPGVQIDVLHLPLKERDILQKLANGVHDIREVEVAGCNLVQHRGEQEEILFIDQRDFDVWTSGEALLKFECRVKARESAAHNDDFVLLAHNWPLSGARHLLRSGNRSAPSMRCKSACFVTDEDGGIRSKV